MAITENPFRAHAAPPPSNSRRLWTLFFVTALGFSVLWLSWTLLIDENEDGLDFDDEHEETTFPEDELAGPVDKKKLRNKPGDIDDLNDDRIPLHRDHDVSRPEDDDDEEENIGDDHHDEDTMTHEDKLHRAVEQAAQRKAKEQQKKSSEKPTKAIVEDEDEIRLDDNFLEADDEDSKAENKNSKSPDTKTSSKKLSDTKTEKKRAPVLTVDEEDEEISDDTPKKPKDTMSGKSSKQSEGDDEDIEDIKALAEEDDDDDGNEPGDSHMSVKETQKKSTSTQDRGKDKPLTPMKDEDEHDILMGDNEDDENDDEDEPRAPAAADDDEDEEIPPPKKVTPSKTESKGKIDVARKAANPDDDEDDDLLAPPGRDTGDDDDGESITANENDNGDNDDIEERGRQASTKPKAPMSKEAPKSSKSAPADDADDDTLAPQDDEDDNLPKKKTPSKASSSVVYFDDDDEDVDDVSVKKPDASLARKGDKATPKPQEDDEDADEFLSAKKFTPSKGADATKKTPNAVEADEDEAANDDAFFSQNDDDEDLDEDETAPAQKTSSSSKKSSTAETQAKEKSSGPSKLSPIDVGKDKSSKAVPSDTSKEKPSKAIPSDVSKDFAMDDEDEDILEADTDVEEEDERDDETPIIGCESLRKKDDCDSREDCKWKYPKSETKGFFCQSLEKCEDAVAQKKTKCLSLPKCAWTRVSASSYGCRHASSATREDVAPEKASKDERPAATDDNEDDAAEGTVKSDEVCEAHERKSKCVADSGCAWVRVASQPTTYGCRSSNFENAEEESPREDDNAEETSKADDEGEDVETPSTKQVPSAASQGEDEVPTETTEKGPSEADDVAAEEQQPVEECSTIQLKAACQIRTDCFWKYPVSKSKGRYCYERKLSIKVSPEKGQLYESIMGGKMPLYDDAKLQPPKRSPQLLAKFKNLGTDWKRHKTDLSCVLHPECIARENVTSDPFFKSFPIMEMPATYVKAQCCTSHPLLRGLFFQVVDFLNREGIAWWLSSYDVLNALFSDGYLLPWTTQITIEVPVFGSKTAVDWASDNELRANLTSYATTKTKVLRSSSASRSFFATRLLQFNSETQHLPNAMRVCGRKFVSGTDGKNTEDSYSPDWLKSEPSGSEQCVVAEKGSKLSSSKTPTHFLVSHIEEIDGKGPSIKIVPRILRTASTDSCMEMWRPGGDFEPIAVKSIFPTAPCFGHGNFQGFSGITRCPKDAKAYLAWQLAAKGKPNFLSANAKANLEEFRKWNEFDLCARGLKKSP